MYKSKFHVVEGAIQGFPCLTAPGQYGDYYIPLNVKDASELFADLKDERQTILDSYTNTDLAVTDPPFKMEGSLLSLRLKWKEKNVANGEIVIVDDKGQPLSGVSNQELQFAKLKLSFSMFGWEYLGKVGVKLQPRKIQLLEYGTLNDLFPSEVEKEVIGTDF